ncbi:ABC transporter ATP-binding protein [Rhodovibrio sodomensis]|uniref:ABC transporter ATP-binding protein n=1 Tax=Rhodovibrio sodomensis TaxID=1088 RepID=A0ABS1DIU2_9PROT|nr:ABC transporter ATP-binding protein [Rhodovibrio sodomensis]MBK1670392.1 ABC transporter ATP-binding protein [Rhodovibrio sodomensis]
MSDHPTSIELTGCAKTFTDGTPAVRRADLQIAGGETLVLLGPSGCGKTTLLRLIAGLEQPDAGGRVLFAGTDVTDQPIERRRVGMVFQSYALFPNMSVRDNVGYGLRVRRWSRRARRERVDELLSMMRLDELGDRHVDQLSGGQRQRVALARAIAIEPHVLLLDEPLTALDALLRERLRVELDQLLRRLGTTTVYVTHDQAEAMALGDRLAIMNAGEIVQLASPEEVYFQPADGFVADFVGTINRLAAATRDGRLEVLGTEIGPCADNNSAVVRSVLVRPENVTVCAPDAAHFVGTVETALFLGDRQRVVLAGIGHRGLAVDAPARADVRVGQRLPVRLDTDHVILSCEPELETTE